MGETIAYNENDHEKKTWADDLGQLQGGIIKGTITSTSPNAYFMGLELLKEFPNAKADGEYFLKKDGVGKGSGNSSRSKNRIIVKVDAGGALVENTGWLWRHDDRVLALGSGFFTRAQMMRKFITG